MPDSRARHTSSSTWLSWHRIVTSVGDVIGTWAPGWCRRNRTNGCGKREEPPRWRRLLGRLRLGCRRLRGCLWGQVARIGVRGELVRPPDDGQHEAAPLAPHLLARTGFHRTRLLVGHPSGWSWGETVHAPSQDAANRGATSTEFLAGRGASAPEAAAAAPGDTDRASRSRGSPPVGSRATGPAGPHQADGPALVRPGGADGGVAGRHHRSRPALRLRAGRRDGNKCCSPARPVALGALVGRQSRQVVLRHGPARRPL